MGPDVRVIKFSKRRRGSKYKTLVPIHILAKREEPEEPQITQLQLSECVVIENEIRLLRKALEEKRANLRRRLKEGETVEEGPLEGFAPSIARGRFP